MRHEIKFDMESSEIPIGDIAISLILQATLGTLLQGPQYRRTLYAAPSHPRLILEIYFLIHLILLCLQFTKTSYMGGSLFHCSIFLIVTRRGERVLRAGFGENWVLKSRKLAFKSYQVCLDQINIKEVIHI